MVAAESTATEVKVQRLIKKKLNKMIKPDKVQEEGGF